jgi:hypothetical protein
MVLTLTGLKVESAKREILHEELLQEFMLNRHYDRLQDARDYVEHQQQGFARQVRSNKCYQTLKQIFFFIII